MKSPQFNIAHFRDAAPYINAHRGKVAVVFFGGEIVTDARFPNLIHDLALLHSLGMRLALVHGARPQIDGRIARRRLLPKYHRGLRVTGPDALSAVKEAVACVRVEIEARLSMGLVNTPMSGMQLRVVSGNFVTARPLGVHDGVDYHYTGEVRSIAADALRQQLNLGQIPLLSALGYSPTGETFNVNSLEVACATATALEADKLILLIAQETDWPTSAGGAQQLGLGEARALLARREPSIPETFARPLAQAIFACEHGVRRAHLLDGGTDGAILKELFTRDGAGLMITGEIYEDLRKAHIDDVGGILELIAPLERQGALVKRSREQLELEIDRFVIIERDGMAIGCGALYPFPDEGMGEIACLAIHPDYRGEHRGDALLQHLEQRARTLGLNTLFVLTTRTEHWFVERGFHQATLGAIPVERQALYNLQRNSKVFLKTPGPT